MKIVKICCMTIIVCLLTGCGLFDSDKTEFIPAKGNKSDKWGFMSIDGEMIIENEFENTPTLPMGGVFSVKEKDGYSVFLLKDRPELIKGCENLQSVGCMSNGVMPIAKKGKRIQYINEKGETLFTLNPVNNKEVASVSAYFDDSGYSIIETEDNNFGYINTKGEVVINPIYSYAHPFSEDGYALVCKYVDNKTKWQIIDNTGKTILKIGEKYNPCYPFVINKKLAVVVDDKYGFLDIEGKYSRCPETVEEIAEIKKDGFVFQSKGKYGFMNKDCEQIIRAKYSKIKILNNGKLLANNENEFLILNSKGEKEVSIDGYNDIFVIPNTNILLAKIGNEWELIDYAGKVVSTNPLSEVNIFHTPSFSSEYALYILESVASNPLAIINLSRGIVYSDFENLDYYSYDFDVLGSIEDSYYGDGYEAKNLASIAAEETKYQQKDLAYERKMYGNCTLKGTIAGSSFTITLTNGFDGYSCYNPKYGTMDIYGEGESYEGYLNLSEYHNGNYVGVYQGTFDGNTFKGTYYRNKDGKAMDFVMYAQ